MKFIVWKIQHICKMFILFQCMCLWFCLTSSAYAADFKPIQNISRVRFVRVRRDLNPSIISDASSANSLIACVAICTKKVSSTSLYFVQEDQTCHCNNEADISTEDDPNKPEIIYGHFGLLAKVFEDDGKRRLHTILPKADCLDILEAGFTSDGVYTIQPTGQDPVDAWCDMQNGGWTVIQRRLDGSEEFYRGWSDYVSGFGNRTGEYWLGLDNIHALTSQPSELYIYVESFGDKVPLSGYARYTTFIVYGPTLKYKIYVDGLTSSCGGDPFLRGNNMSFSTFDNDNDANPVNSCSQKFHGAWWYAKCHNANLNGLYSTNPVENGQGLNLPPCWGFYYSAKETVMKVKRTLL